MLQATTALRQADDVALTFLSMRSGSAAGLSSVATGCREQTVGNGVTGVVMQRTLRGLPPFRHLGIDVRTLPVSEDGATVMVVVATIPTTSAIALATLAMVRSRSGLPSELAVCARDVGERSFEALRSALATPLCRLTIAEDFFAGTFAKILIDLAEDQ